MRRWFGTVMGVVVGVFASTHGAHTALAKGGSEIAPVVHDGAFVRTSDSDDFAPATDGAAVVSGNGVRSAANRGARLDIADGVDIRFAPNTSMVIRTAQFLPAEHPGAAVVRALQVSLMSGEIDVDVHDPKGANGVTVLLPGGRSVAIWRGAANISLDGEKVAVALYEGMAIAGSGTKWQPLSAGKGAVLAPKTDPVTRPIPGKTDWSKGAGTPPSFVLVRGTEGGVVGASWTAAPGAAGYRVELGHDADMAGDLTMSNATEPTFKTDPLAAGMYALRVRAVSPDGIMGPASSPTLLRVARVTLPKGAFAAADGNVVLPVGGALQLDDPRDLEVATVVRHDMPDDQLFWTPASNQIALGTGNRREIRVRHVPSKTEMAFVLVRRALKAHVAFTPNHPKWPHDAVEIIVKVEDLSGYVDASHEVIDINARLDMDRMTLNWQHEGDTWTARVPPQKGTNGPWVIRVDVNDSAGAPIGANLLDIDGPAGPPLQQAAYRLSSFQGE